ncbi:MAG TPA: hypothetical protein VH764_18685 [Gemmatimonadales bacterium]
MTTYRLKLVSVGIMSTAAVTGCGGGGPYASQAALDSLRAQLVATHDTMVAMWAVTDSMNQILRDFATKDTTPPPTCPPRCLEMRLPPDIPDPPDQIGP